MTEQLPETTPPQSKGKIWRIIRWIVLGLIGFLLALIIALGLLASSDRGSHWLLDFVMNRQQMVHYQYEQGNLVRGLILKDILVKVKDVEVQIDRADVRLGWRALVKRELHFMTAKVGTVHVINHAPPNDDPFKFSELKLPFVLRLDDANLAKLVIQSAESTVNFYNIHLNDAVWSGTKIQLVNSSLDMDFLNVKKVTGFILLQDKYPLNLRADLTIPALKDLNLHQIKVSARGDVDTLRAGVASATPDVISGYVVAHPVRKDVPMQGKLSWQTFHWPIAPEQKLYSEKGQIDLSGDLKQLNFVLDSDLEGENIPKGNYQALLNTDLKQMNIEKFVGSLMNGQLDLSGHLNWENGLVWDIKGRAQGLNPKDKNIPEEIQGFLPPDMSSQISSKGSMDKQSDILATLDFDRYERWDVHLKQNPSTQNQSAQNQSKEKQQPWLMNVSWSNINREMPYIGWLNSRKGDVDIVLAEQGQDIKVATDIDANEKSSLPAGHYQSTLNFANNILNIKNFSLTQGQSSLSGQAVVNLPTDKTQLKWHADLNAKQFNPQTISSAAPVNRLDGRLTAQGYQDNLKQVIQLKGIDLKGQIPQGNTSQSVSLTGQSTAVVIMHDGKNQSGLKSFAVQYNGALNAQNYSQGPLRLNLSGTPSMIKLTELYHQGAAGEIKANGTVNLAQGLAWDIHANLQQFKPQFFVSTVKGEITGQVNSTGQWSDRQKHISIRDLNLRGQLNNKPLLGQGNLALSFSDVNGFVPKQFEANNLVLSYANNILHASGNAQRLQLNINASNLSELYQGLRGTVKGFISVQTHPKLNARSNLIVQNFAYNNVASIENLSLVGTLPTGDQASQMVMHLQNLRSGERGIDDAKLELQGTRAAHLLKIQGQNSISKFYVQFAGGLNQNNDWLGQIQKGSFESKRVSLQQSQNAALIFRKNQNQLAITQHCWISQGREQSQICLDQPLIASQNQGAVSVQIKNIELGDFAAFMPTGLALSGKLNGYSHVSWLNGQPMQMDTQLVTKSGNIGISSDDLDVPAASLAYNELRLGAKTLPQGLALRLNADTPLLGTGFVSLLVGTQGQDKAISGDIALDQVKLSLFKPFISDIRVLDGKLSAAGKLSGTLQQPLFNGEIRLKDGQLAMISVPLNLQNIQLASSIRGSQATVTGGFNAGRGVGKISGNADWGASPIIKLNLSGQELLVAQPPLVSASVSPEINVDIRPALKQLTVNGKVDVPRAVISMPESSPNVIATSADVRIVKSGQDQLAILKAATPWNIRADIAVSLGDAVVFRGFNSVIPLAGRINLSQRGTAIAMQASGAVGVSQQVKIEAYGQSLDLNRAIARFGGELANPSLDIDATKSVQNSTVGVRVTGVASRPNIQIYNDAGLTEQEALNALLTGRISSGSSGVNNTEGFKSDVNNTIAAAGISMGLGGTRAFTNQIGRTFGLSGLALDAQGSGDDTQVSVTGYITPDLYLRYGVGIFTPVNKLTLRYQVNRRLYMEASSSVERAVDIFYNWKF
ncbi:translocation/assembly module TamB domain-containing protein [Acinetobacter populi]|uniref:Translocation and assembly module TamB C-terminal domain-containing protein n=1 Tax=Acinetobacter populi TaxID=1582270 RepID=A0A1Z9YY04_9GAMM|nr:translocation/assembly module TamB domain-containing protein [Acinetobacter populi]OUY07085.1 hypothetical protein CAP51_10375 [Acinetobacter populi]